jgi:uncharacterized protein YgbK (DUF1537 family)
MPRPDRPCIAVLADDLTGALASAACLREAGLRVGVSWRHDLPLPAADALVIDMRSRDAGDPYTEARRWSQRLHELGCRRFELRVDSTLRGVPDLELAGLLEGSGAADAIVMAIPAYPAAGRVTRRGLQVLTDGSPRDGLDLRVVDRLFGGAPAEVVSADELDEAPAAVVEHIIEAAHNGIRRFCLDAERDRHLRAAAAVVAAVEARGPHVITMSPGAWLRHFPAARTYVVVALSSATPQNRTGLAYLRASGDVELSNAGELLGRDAEELPVAPLVVIETLSDAGHAEPGRLARRTAQAVRRLLDARGAAGDTCRGLVVSGGHTASCVADALEAVRLEVQREILPLCPLSGLVGGPWSGLRLITKGGMVGRSPRTLTRLVQSLDDDATCSSHDR